ncbi:MAG: Gfo/Idh/MocA family oxidoreductase, partial [Spirochaetales bacterium]|nr:Gfo/Idh/MocA family oxidoreductase [Spirochaetales bacterium]
MGISLGLVGLGAFGSSFAPLFKSHPLVDRVALCDREPDRIKKWADRPSFQDKFNVRDTYETIDDICNADLDGIVIVTQPFFHAPQAVQAMLKGKHVYSAVPIMMVPDGDEIIEWCQKLIDTSKTTGQYYMLGETTYYRPQAMYCRRQAAQGAFGRFVYAEGEYYHDVDHGLREVKERREGSATGKEWQKTMKEKYAGVVSGPMHYPTHSTAGPVCVMNAYAEKVCAFPYFNNTGEQWHGINMANETALFRMSNGAHVRISEYREIGTKGRETFRIYGNEGSFENDTWQDKNDLSDVPVEQMRDPLPEEVASAFQNELNAGQVVDGLSQQEKMDYLGGHGGSHAHLVHEFVSAIAEDRQPAVNIWEAARYMIMGI